MLQIVIDLVMALIIGLLVFLGIKRGFVKSFFKSTKIIFVILITMIIGSLVVGLCQNAFVNGMFEGKITEKLVAKAESDMANFGVEQINDELPAIVKNIIPMSEIEEYFEKLPGDSVEKARAIGEAMEDALISVVSNVVGYMISFAIAFVICTIAIFVIDKVFSLPMLNWLNRIGGVFWGVANAYLTTSFLVCIVALVLGNDFVNSTFITKFIYYIGLFTF